MMWLAEFGVKVGLFILLVFLPWKTRNETSFVNVDISCIQIATVAVVYTLYYTCIQIFDSIRKQRYKNVNFDENGLDEIYLGDLEDFDAGEIQQEQETSSTKTETKSVQTEPVQLAQPTQLANFEYILQTHVLGIVIFMTFMFVDGNDRTATDNFIHGIIIGHILYFIYLRCFVSFTPSQHIPLMVCNILSVSLVFVMNQKIVIPDNFIESKSFFANLCVSFVFPFLSGFMWGFYYSRPHIAAITIDTARNSIITILLLCCPVFVMMDPTQLPDFPGVSVFFNFIIDPLVKFFCVQMIVLSIESAKTLELIIILLISEVLDYRYNYDMNSVASVVIVCCLCLVYTSIVVIDFFKGMKKRNEIIVFQRENE